MSFLCKSKVEDEVVGSKLTGCTCNLIIKSFFLNKLT